MHSILQLSAFPADETLWDAVRAQCTFHHCSLEQLLPEQRAQITILLSCITDPITPAVLEQLPNLRLIANYGAGIEHIERVQLQARGIQLSNTPGVLSTAVADLTWGLILALRRQILQGDALLRQGQFTGWTPFSYLSPDVSGQTLGLIGCGEIGQKVALRAIGFEMQTLYTQRTRLPALLEERLQLTYCPLDALLGESDIVSLHCPLTPETHHLINAQTLAKMSPHSCLINTTRGAVVDEAALAEALQTRLISGAGLDVFEREPTVHPDLLRCSNTILTPHIGSATEASRYAMGNLVLKNVLAFLSGKPLLTPAPKITH